MRLKFCQMGTIRRDTPWSHGMGEPCSASVTSFSKGGLLVYSLGKMCRTAFPPLFFSYCLTGIHAAYLFDDLIHPMFLSST
jgi:hypothetical protein